MKFALSVVLLVGVMSCPARLPEARAEGTNKSRAEALLEQGNTLYDKADYKGALDKFKQANALYPTPEIELNIGLTHEHLKDLPAAATHFERFLGQVDRRDDGARARGVQQKMEALRKRLGSVTVVCKVKAAAVIVDGEPAGSTPLGHRLYVLPGRHALAVIAAGQKPFNKTLDLRAGQHRTLKVLLPTAHTAKEPGTALDLTPVPPDKTAPRPFYKKWWFWTAVGVVVAGTATAVVATQTGGSETSSWPELGKFK